MPRDRTDVTGRFVAVADVTGQQGNDQMGMDEDAAIFDSGNAPEPSTSTPAQPTFPTEPASPSYGSDHEAVSAAISSLSRQGGRDQPVAREPAQPAPVPEQTQTREPPAPPDVEDRSTAGLLKALLDERSARQNLERDLADRRRREEAAERERRANQTPFDQRLFEQPQQTVDGAIEERLTPIQQRMQSMSTDIDFKLTAIQHGKDNFDAAFKAWYAQVGDPARPNPTLYWDVMNAASPGERIMELHQRQQLYDETGGDLAGYRAKVEAEILAKYGLTPAGAPAAPAPPAAQHYADDPPRAPNGQFVSPARHELRLPTATSRGGRSGSGSPDASMDGSDEAIFDAGRPERRR